MITKLTPDQIELMETVKNKWINFALFEGDEIDVKATYKGIDWLYELSGYKKPIKIIVDSPLGVQLALPYAKALLDAAGKGIEGSQVYNQVGSQVRNQVYNQVDSQVRSQVDSQVRNQVRNQVYNQVGSQVGSQVRSQVRSQVGSQVRNQVDNPETFAPNTLGWYSGWMAFIDFFKEIGVVKYDKWDEYEAYMKSGQFMGVYLDGLAVVCRRPQHVRRDPEFNLHHDQLPAIEWRDGFKLNFLRGEHFEQELFDKIANQTLTVKEALQIEDSDQRTIAQSMLRPDEMHKQLKGKLVNTGILGTKLYRCDKFMGTSETEYYMWMKDASTPREFIEFVPPEVIKQVGEDAEACQAAAWRDSDGDQLPLEDYLLAGQRG